MLNITLAWDNKLDAGTVTASNAATLFPAVNVQSGFRQATWRSTTLTPTITVDLGSAMSIGAAIILDHNVTSSGTIELRASTDNFGASNVLIDTFTTSEIMDPLPYYFTEQSYRYWRFTFSDGTNPAGYIEVGRIFIGPKTVPTNNYSYTWSVELVETSDVKRGRTGVVQAKQTPIFERYNLRFDEVSESQRAELDAIFRSVGRHTPGFFSLDRTNYLEARTVYGRITSLSPMENSGVLELFTYSVTIEEDL